MAQYGCATHPPSADLHWQLHTEVTALIPAQLKTELSIEPYASNRPAGALKGAGQGAMSMLDAMGNSSLHCEGWPCGFVLLMMLAIVVTAAGVGAVVGAVKATPAEKTDHLGSAIDQLTRKLVTHLDLAQRVSRAAGQVEGLTIELVDDEELVWMEEKNRWEALSRTGFVNALEIGVTDLEFLGGSGNDPELSLRMTAKARLIHLASKDEIYSEEFYYTAPQRRFSQWAANQGDMIRRAVEQGLTRLSEDISNRLFEQTELPIPSGLSALPWSDKFGCCWLCPKSPAHDLSHKFWKGTIEINDRVVSSQQPELSWEDFPRPDQAAGLLEFTEGIVPEVRYDLRIWERRQGDLGPLVYERRGLSESKHRLQDQLRSGGKYFWSFRACFSVEKGKVCTPWAFSSVPAVPSCEIPSVPVTNYFRFNVP
jgi:hypothetical protein